MAIAASRLIRAVALGEIEMSSTEAFGPSMPVADSGGGVARASGVRRKSGCLGRQRVCAARRGVRWSLEDARTRSGFGQRVGQPPHGDPASTSDSTDGQARILCDELDPGAGRETAAWAVGCQRSATVPFA